MKNRQLNREEEVLRDKLSELNYEFQPADWDALEKQLPSSGSGSSWLSGKAIVGAAVVVSLTAAWFISQPAADNETAVQKEKKAVQTEQKDAVSPKTEDQTQSSTTTQLTENSERASEEEVLSTDETVVAENVTSNANEESSPLESSSNEERSQIMDEAADENIQFSEENSDEAEIAAEQKRTESEEPNINGIIAPDKVCANQDFRVELDMKADLPEGYTVDWLIDNKRFIVGSKITGMEISENGMKTISAEVKGPTVDIPELDFTYEDLKDPYLDFSAKVEVTDDLFDSYEWLGEDGKILAKGANPSIDFRNKGVYDLKIRAKTAEGCYQEISKPLAIAEDFDPMAPNAFTPLNQDERNQTFMPAAFKLRDDRYKMQIMSLDGNLIYESNSIKDEWNGRMHNSGQMLPAGQYLWKVIISNNEGRQRTFIGNIRILPD